MTIDSTLPEENQSSSPQANPNAGGPGGPRQKQSFRRRKRRGPGAIPGQSAPSQQGAPNPPQANGMQANGTQGNGAQANGGASGNPQPGGPRNENQPKKPKKRFFKKNRNQNPGQNQGQNQNSNGGQNQANARNARSDSRGNGQQPRRASKQRKPKVFVGPMDHSYRAVNGNYSDAPPSTIELQRGYTNVHYNGNGNGNFNGNNAGRSNGSTSVEAMEASANAAAALENSSARIYCFIDDLFFTAKIQETARKLGIKIAFVKNDKETVAQLLALPEEERPSLIVFDLNNANAKPLTLIPKLKLKLKRATSIVGFLSHLQGELKAKAIEAGCDSVMPRSAFSQTLPNLLRRYGVEAEPELDDSQSIIAEA